MESPHDLVLQYRDNEPRKRCHATAAPSGLMINDDGARVEPLERREKPQAKGFSNTPSSETKGLSPTSSGARVRSPPRAR
jgi:hypothetical protein